MNRKYFTIIIALLMLCSATASAQYSDTASANYKQHSIEITTGYPSIIHFFEYPLQESMDIRHNGQTLKQYYQPGINVGYTYQWHKRWEVNALLNSHLTIKDFYQYPLLPEHADLAPSEAGSSQYYDWDATPTFINRQTKLYGALCASVRFKWIARESFSMYSGLGVGTSFAVPFPLPYIAPIGIQFGKGKVFGIVEANISAANTFGMFGIGIRL